MSVFHFLEYLYVALFHIDVLSTDSFLLNHSHAFNISWFLSTVEYLVEMTLFSQAKQFDFISIIGAAIVFGGQALRSIAMFTAGSNFNHTIEDHKRSDHELVTSGIYKVFHVNFDLRVLLK